MRRLTHASIPVVVALFVVGACGNMPEVQEGPDPGSPGDTDPVVGDTAPDTARGVVAVVGSDPGTFVALRPAAGGSLTLTGPHRSVLERLAGIEIWVRGAREDDRFRVAAFQVRAVDGVPATDGVLTMASDALYLVSSDGDRQRVTYPPVRLREMVGDRVWIAGPLDEEPVAFGWISEPET
jgi:hypothetical protein